MITEELINETNLRKSEKTIAISEPVPAPFEGEYRDLLMKLMASTWVPVVYVLASLIITYVLGHVHSPIIFFTVIQIPTLIACSYVVSPNPNLTYRLPINWIATAILAAFVYASQTSETYYGYSELGDEIGMVAWFFAIYWTLSAVIWSIKMRKVNKDKLSRLESVEFFGELFATWGAALQVAFIFSWIVIPFLEGITYGAATARSLAVTVEAFRGMSILRFLPVSVLLLGLLIMVSFRFQIDPYRPKTMNEVLPVKKGSLLVSLLIALRIPVWILIVIIGFINHFSKLLWESTRDFFKNFLARLCFIFVGLVLAPALLYFGHIILLKSLHLVTQYLDSETFGFFGNIKQFFIVNLLVLITLCVYVISVPPLAVRYRGETIVSPR
ncbi:MAG: hypothetical protein ONB46_23680 [candidate division KSB1 bacterium]|nr:hypothetical protein [candidate division KSB1 bacterium]MDZ7368868.1 hypothetical protein [candidate division KSB1 bacterium]MDZ7407153.1 hypothetical protein [candidate division KSB1 bacterium]